MASPAVSYRTAYLEPELFFKYSDRDAMFEAARGKVKQVLADHHFELPADARRDVAEVYAAAVKEVEAARAS